MGEAESQAKLLFTTQRTWHLKVEKMNSTPSVLQKREIKAREKEARGLPLAFFSDARKRRDQL